MMGCGYPGVVLVNKASVETKLFAYYTLIRCAYNSLPSLI